MPRLSRWQNLLCRLTPRQFWAGFLLAGLLTFLLLYGCAVTGRPSVALSAAPSTDAP